MKSVHGIGALHASPLNFNLLAFPAVSLFTLVDGNSYFVRVATAFLFVEDAGCSCTT